MENTTENNKLLAEFMKAKVTVDTYFILGMYMHINESDLKYHSDWNWLMEVVEKIESLENGRFKVEIYNDVCRIYDHEYFEDILDLSEHTKIQAVYNACIQFVKWYNEQ